MLLLSSYDTEGRCLREQPNLTDLWDSMELQRVAADSAQLDSHMQFSEFTKLSLYLKMSAGKTTPPLATSVLDTRTTTRCVRLYCSPHASSPPLTFLPASGASHDMDGAKLTLQLSPLAMIGSRTSCLKRRSAEPLKAASTCPRGSEHSTIKARGFHDQRAHQLSLWSQPSRKSPANPGAQPTMAATCSAHAHVRAERDGYAPTPDWLRSGYCKVLGKGEQAGSSLAF